MCVFGGECLPCDKSVGAIAPKAPERPMPLTPVQYKCNTPVQLHVKNTSVTWRPYGLDHVEETMGYEHAVKGMSALMEAMRHERPEKTPQYHFSADTIMISHSN